MSLLKLIKLIYGVVNPVVVISLILSFGNPKHLPLLIGCIKYLLSLIISLTNVKVF